MEFITIETTYPNLEEAKNLGQILLQKKLAACVQFSKINSSYIWQDKIENSDEILVTIKSKNDFFEQIEKIIKQHHQYDTVQIIAKNITKASDDYLQWLKSSLTNVK